MHLLGVNPVLGMGKVGYVKLEIFLCRMVCRKHYSYLELFGRDEQTDILAECFTTLRMGIARECMCTPKARTLKFGGHNSKG